MPTFRLTLEYDGSGFQGWQVQPGGRRTVQGALEAAVQQVTSERVRVAGSGRTDAGVHAEGQVASLVLAEPVEPERLRQALNGVLPEDVAVLALEPAPEGFDARRSARGKLYRYRVWNGATRSPLRAARTLWVRRPLDAIAMAKAMEAFAGTHDFASFQAAGSDVTETVRTLLRVGLEGRAGDELRLHFEGTGFLRHMVRNLMGTLLEVGLCKRDPGEMASLVAARDRRLAGPTAAAHALSLVRVDYDSPVGSAPSA